MKKVYVVYKKALIIIMLMGAFTLNAQTHITDAAGLDAMRNDVTGSYVLDNDIDLSTTSWVSFEFKGTLDGQGFSIKNLEVTIGDENAGLFSVLNGATVTNLGLEDAYTECTTNGGTLAGKVLSSTITRCFAVSGSLGSEVHSGGLTGGLFGYSENSTISECYTEGVYVAGHDHVGGIVGHMKGGQIHDCYVNSDIYSDGWQVGGIVGWAEQDETIITRCYGKGTVKSESGFTGGIIGIAVNAPNKVLIIQCMSLYTKIETVNPDIEKTYRIIGDHNSGEYYDNFGLSNIELIDPHKSAWEDDSNGKDGASITMDDVTDAQFYTDSLPDWDFINVWKLTTEGPILRMGVSTSISKEKAPLNAKVYAHDGFITVMGADINSTLRIYNITGNLILESNIKSDEERYNVKGLVIIEIETPKTRGVFKVNNL